MKKIFTVCVSVLLSLSFLVPFISFNTLSVDAYVDGSEIIFDDLSGFSCEELNALVEKVLNVYNYQNPVLYYSPTTFYLADVVPFSGGSNGNMYYHKRVFMKRSDFSVTEQDEGSAWSNISLNHFGFLFCDYTGTVKTSTGLTVTNLNEVTKSDFMSALDDKCSVTFYDVNILPGPNGTVSPIIQDSYIKGSSLTVEAIPNPNYYFSGWTDGNYDNPRTFVVNSDLNVAATFQELPKYTVTLSSNGNGQVTGAGTYYSGTNVMISAVPDEGYYFDKWSDGSVELVRQFVITEDINLSASFEKYEPSACLFSSNLLSNDTIFSLVDTVQRAFKYGNTVWNDWVLYHHYSYLVPQWDLSSHAYDIKYPVRDWYEIKSLIDPSVSFVMDQDYIYGTYIEYVYTGFQIDGNWFDQYEVISHKLDPMISVTISGNHLISTTTSAMVLTKSCFSQVYDDSYMQMLQYGQLAGINTSLNNLDSKFDIFNNLLENLGLQTNTTNSLIQSGTPQSSQVADQNDALNSELTSSIDQHNQIELEYQQQMSNAMNNIDFNVDLGNVSNFTSTAAFISGQMDQFFNLNPSIKMLLTFPMICGLAMLIIGRLKK